MWVSCTLWPILNCVYVLNEPREGHCSIRVLGCAKVFVNFGREQVCFTYVCWTLSGTGLGTKLLHFRRIDRPLDTCLGCGTGCSSRSGDDRRMHRSLCKTCPQGGQQTWQHYLHFRKIDRHLDTCLGSGIGSTCTSRVNRHVGRSLCKECPQGGTNLEHF